MYNVYIGESGLVYRGYLKSGAGRDLVAVKTIKGNLYLFSFENWVSTFVLLMAALSSFTNKEKLLKEVKMMVSFQHPNVMSLLGLSFDEDVPLLIMPFMSGGNILGFVRQNKEELYCDQVNIEHGTHGIQVYKSFHQIKGDVQKRGNTKSPYIAKR